MEKTVKIVGGPHCGEEVQLDENHEGYGLFIFDDEDLQELEADTVVSCHIIEEHANTAKFLGQKYFNEIQESESLEELFDIN